MSSERCINGGTTSECVSAEMQRILRVAGIESAPMDPSSAKCLRELIAFELEAKEHNVIGAVSSSQTEKESKKKKPGSSNETKDSAAKVSTLSGSAVKPSTVEAIAPASAKTQSKSSDALLTNPDTTESTSTEEPVAVDAYSSLKQQLESQRKSLEEQSKIISQLTSHVHELSSAVQSLQKTVEHLNQSSTTTVRTPAGGSVSNVQGTQRDRNENDANANAMHLRPQNNANEFQRAHMLAHHVAWRVATFPLRAILFYLKYEYRTWIVMYRLARRDVLDPFREAGMIFQLGFALIIVYGRIAPALENALNEQKRNQHQSGESGDGESQNSEDDHYEYDYGEALLEDAEFQIQAIVIAILVGFFYHFGVFGLVYRFFIRDRLHVRIWNDLREGVELTPTYGLDFDEDPPPELNGNENNDANNMNNRGNNDANNENNNDNNNNMREARQGRNNDNNNNENMNNIPPPANRNHNRIRDIDNDNGPLVDMANAIGNGINDFFMGYGRRRRAAQQAEAVMAAGEPLLQAQREGQEPAQAEADQDDDETMDFDPVNALPDHRNPIVGLFSDILCLFYSFFVSILPGWNYEQQLRDIRDEDDRRLRAIMQREAEALRNQHINDDEDNASSGSDSSGSDSSGSEADSESESDSEDEYNR